MLKTYLAHTSDGIEYKVQLTEEAAKARGLEPVVKPEPSVKQRKPRNKARKTNNK